MDRIKKHYIKLKERKLTLIVTEDGAMKSSDGVVTNTNEETLKPEDVEFHDDHAV